MLHLHQLINTYFKPFYLDSHMYSFQTDQRPVAQKLASGLTANLWLKIRSFTAFSRRSDNEDRGKSSEQGKKWEVVHFMNAWTRLRVFVALKEERQLLPATSRNMQVTSEYNHHHLLNLLFVTKSVQPSSRFPCRRFQGRRLLGMLTIE